MSANPKRKPTRHDDDTPSSTPRPARALRAVNDEGSPSRVAESVPDLDRVIHERARLAIVSALATAPSRTHNELRDVLALTDGNLSVHARRLEEVGYIACTKDFAGRTPRTTYSLTPAGRAAFERYLSHMEALIHAMKAKT